MKKYIAFAMPGNQGGNSVQTSKILTKEAATQWAHNQVAKNFNMKAYICEVISVASRPDPVVTVMPFTPEPETETALTHGA